MTDKITKEESRRIIEVAKALRVIKVQIKDLRGLGIRFIEVTKTKKECELEAKKRHGGCSFGNDRAMFLEGAMFGSNNE